MRGAPRDSHMSAEPDRSAGPATVRVPRTAQISPSSMQSRQMRLPASVDARETEYTPLGSAYPQYQYADAAHASNYSVSAGMGSATALPGLPALPYGASAYATSEPEVWLIAHSTPAGVVHSLEGAGRPGAIRVGRPYGHLRSVQPVLPPGTFETLEGAPVSSGPGASSASGRVRRGRGSKKLDSNLPAQRPAPMIVSAVEVETDAGIFRVERPGAVLGHSDVAWALANLESGEPDSIVPLPRRQLAMLLTLLPTPEDPEHPEQDPAWGWAHRLRGPWERGPLHTKGRLGRLISIDPDPSGRGQHRACFELLGSEEVVWALGVPCFRSGSVYELVPLARSRWLSWPLAKSRTRAGTAERPQWEIARVVYRVGAPRWPLAGVVEPMGPMGIGG